MDLISTTPFMIRAIFEWCEENGLKPYLRVEVKNGVMGVPPQFIENDEVVLNISSEATHNLVLGNDSIHFDVRFSGKPCHVQIPVDQVRAIFSPETGVGIGFVVMDSGETEMVTNDAENVDSQNSDGTSSKIKPFLKRIK